MRSLARSKRSRWRLGLVAAGLLAALAWLGLGRAPIDAAAYRPPAGAALEGPLAPNDRLDQTELLARGRVRGPEDIAVDGLGRMYVGMANGEIVRLSHPDGVERLEVLADTGGRPLGLAWSVDGELLIADAYRGLLALAGDGSLRVLSTEADGVPFRFTDDLDVASDGTVYFTDASHRFDQTRYLYDLLEARPHGRLLRYDPGSGETTVLRDGLYFANGVALSADESFVLVNETYRYRIQQCWLRGPRTGTCEIFADHLPGFPDGVASDRAGTFWVALFTVRNPTMDRLHPHPRLKNLLARLPKRLWPKPAPYGLVLALDETGAVIDSLHDPDGSTVRGATSVEPHGDFLYLGNLDHDWIGRFALGEASRPRHDPAIDAGEE